MARRSTILFLLLSLTPTPVRAESLPGTKPLNREGDLAEQMVAGIDRYLMRELAASVSNRKQYWKPDFSSQDAHDRSVRPNRERLKKILGVVDPRVPFTALEYISTTEAPSLVAESDAFTAHAVRWPVLDGVDAEGLLLEPKGKVLASVVAIPDADQTPEMIAGLTPGVSDQDRFAYYLATHACRVLIPTLIDRQDTWSGNPRLGRMTNQPHREFLYRMSYEMGRHVIGYEIQKVLAAVDWLCRDNKHPPVGIYGYGEGGLVAYYSGALCARPLRAVGVSGFFGPREHSWREPIYRNVWGLLREFGDAEVAAGLFSAHLDPKVRNAVTCPVLLVDANHGPNLDGPPPARPGRSGAAPGGISNPGPEAIRSEVERVWTIRGDSSPFPANLYRDEPRGSDRSDSASKFALLLTGKTPGAESTLPPERKGFDPAPRQKRQFDQLVAFTQKLMRESEDRRRESFWSKLDTSSPENYQASCAPFRPQLAEVIGTLPPPTEPVNPRSRQVYDEPRWKGYEVTIDLYPDVFAFGVLLVPKDLSPGEKRPVVVCQHGLEGRPRDVCNPKERTRFYNSFGAQLADRGYIVYAPQNPYIGHDKFRVLQRKANPLGLSLFSFIVRQHERTLEWLATLPFVDPGRMAFYGLSYGGKTAMRLPALLPRYCLSICSGDFNEWIWKNVSTEFPASYLFSPEYEMPEFNLGHTFNYAEMAALIAPRPFMVERGHDDGVGIDEWVAYEYAKVRRLYSRLKVPDRTEIEFFAGGHEIHGRGTFRFLKRHLKWPE